jgi:peptidoglycan hydrolase-like protein with peptidoglycan-binding domain
MRDLIFKLWGRPTKRRKNHMPWMSWFTGRARTEPATPVTALMQPQAVALHAAPVGDLAELIRVYDGVGAPEPQLRDIILGICAKESDFGRSHLARQHRNFAALRWQIAPGAHESILELGATKVIAEQPGGASAEFYAFPTVEAFIRAFWRRIRMGADLNGWNEHASNPEAFLAFLAVSLDPDARGYVNDVQRAIATMRGEPEPPIDEPQGEISSSNAILFRKAAPGISRPRGMLVEVLQASLREVGLFSGTIDGVYGDATEQAVMRFQRLKGREADGRCRDSDWDLITGLPPPSLFDRCLNLTAAFEGTGFGMAVGNFDDAYLTWGLIGLTLKHDLPGFLQLVEQTHSGTLQRAFREKTGELLSILTASDVAKEAWGNSISVGDNKYGVRADWKEAFARLGSFPEVQRLQIQRANANYWRNICLRDARRWKAADAIDIALFFDMAVQNGGGGRPSIAEPLDHFTNSQHGLAGQARREQWARIIAAGSKPKYQADVLSRRMAIATCQGTVHDAKYNLVDWGLEADPVIIDKLSEDHITYFQESTRPNLGGATQPSAPQIPGQVIDFVTHRDNCVAAALARINHPNLDRNWGRPIDIPIDVMLGNSGLALPGDWRSWDEQRRSIALLQVIATLNSVDPGVIDGRWGTATNSAFETLIMLRDGVPLPSPGDFHPTAANPNGWPSQDSNATLAAFYGPPGVKAGFSPPLKTIICPWKLTIAWDTSKTTDKISCHVKVADSVSRVLKAVHSHYGDAEIKRLRLNVYDGCYNPRKMRKGNRTSTHAWGIALDWDPDNNQLEWGSSRATFARPEYRPWFEIWEREGWVSLGRSTNRDWMHIQAAKL